MPTANSKPWARVSKGPSVNAETKRQATKMVYLLVPWVYHSPTPPHCCLTICSHEMQHLLRPPVMQVYLGYVAPIISCLPPTHFPYRLVQ